MTESKYPVSKEYLAEQIKNYDEYRKLNREGQPLGPAMLDVTGKLPDDTIPTNSLFKFIGVVSALPESANRNEVVLYSGNYYVWNGTSWKKGFATDTVTSVNGNIGDVIIDGDTLTIDFNNIRQSITSAISAAIDIAVPIGTVQALMSVDEATPSSRWLFCDGSEYNIADYPKLAKALGVTTGTTFKVPDMEGRFVEGTNVTNKVGVSTDAGLPNSRGRFYVTEESNESWAGPEGAFTWQNNGGNGCDGDNGCFGWFTMDLKYGEWDIENGCYKSKSGKSTVYGNSDTVQPMAYVINYIMKVKH